MTVPIENEAPPAVASHAELGAAARRPGKAAGAFRTISEVANDLNVPQHVLRFWETRFTQIRPLKRAGGRRYYRPEDVELLRRIRQLLYNNGYTIKGVQRLLRDIPRRGEDEVGGPETEPVEPAVEAAEMPAGEAPNQGAVEAAIGELNEIRELLRKARR